MSKYVVTPTRGINKSLVLLNQEVVAAGATHVIIHPNSRAPVGVPTETSQIVASRVVPEFNLRNSINVVRDSQNFQRWVNLGCKAALDDSNHNCKVLVINDDISVDSSNLNIAFDSLNHYDLISMDDRPSGGVTPMTGWFFGFDPSKILMNEEYVFWWGDDDLWLRALDLNLKVETITTEYYHNRFNPFVKWDPIFDSFMEKDKNLFYTTWQDTL